ncbi:MAG: hypothetical protein AAGD08_15705, partial [Pseudomonadota bacterium]
MTTAAEIKNEESLLAWLNARPEKTRKQDAVTIACRAALRALPLMAKDVERRAAESRDKLLFSSFRAISASWLYAGSGSQDAEIAAYAAAYAADAAAAAAAAAAAFAADAADAAALEEGIGVKALSDRPLWPGTEMPEGLEALWERLKDRLPKDEHWDVWTTWYEARLRGTPANMELEKARVLIPDKDWEQGPAHVNGMIKRLIAEHSESGSGKGPGVSIDQILDAKDLRAALADFELDQLAQLMRMVRFVEDLRDLSDEYERRDRENMLSELADLFGDLSRDIPKHAGNAPGWLSTQASRYQKEAKKGPGEVRPGRLWDLGLSLAGALQDEDIEWSLKGDLFDRFDHAVSKHRDLMRSYFAAVLSRMRPLDTIEKAQDASPADAIDALEVAVDA